MAIWNVCWMCFQRLEVTIYLHCGNKDYKSITRLSSLIQARAAFKIKRMLIICIFCHLDAYLFCLSRVLNIDLLSDRMNYVSIICVHIKNICGNLKLAHWFHWNLLIKGVQPAQFAAPTSWPFDRKVLRNMASRSANGDIATMWLSGMVTMNFSGLMGKHGHSLCISLNSTGMLLDSSFNVFKTWR